MRFDEILAQIPKPNAPLEKTVSVEVSDILGVEARFTYRAPSVYDLYAISDPQVLREWRLQYPEIPDTLAVQIELIARLHLEPATDKPIGHLYVELIEKLGLPKAVALLKRIEGAISEAFGLGDLREQVEAKKS